MRGARRRASPFPRTTSSPGSSTGGRLCAAPLTWNRFSTLHLWLPHAPVERIESPPATPDEWIARFGGASVLVSRADHHPAGHPKHAGWTLHGPSLASLRQFRRIARREPPLDRLKLIWSSVTDQPTRTEPAQAVELYAVPSSVPAVPF